MRISDLSSDVCSSDLLGLVFPAPAEFALRADQDGAGIGVDEKFRDAGRVHPVGIGLCDLDHLGGFAIKRDLAWPAQRGAAVFARLLEGSSEERRVGKEFVSTCRLRGAPYH